MEARDYIESGILELYVYGVLPSDEVLEVNKMAKQHPEVKEEIEAIERSIISLSSGFAPELAAQNYIRIREKLKLRNSSRRRFNVSAFFGWTLAILFLGAAGYLFYERNETRMRVVNIETEKNKLGDSIINLETRNKRTELALGIIRDSNNLIVQLGGQKASPESNAKVYWNTQTRAVFIDAAGLPQPPEGMVYQVWALQFNPLRPTSIGLLDDFNSNATKIFSVENANNAQAFGITLEPAGGSASPTMEQLYVIGKA